MVKELTGAEASHIVTAGAGVPTQSHPIAFAPSGVKSLTGVDVPAQKQQEILEILGFTVVVGSEDDGR